ncbi:MAG: ADP-forming succinate--CoA ligase subunit beta [Alphaproteobacteria bacterium]|nr:ADP-forming succinate--CoA ligase subunit beta [Alphaproteobacteria bacterium]
MNIHEHQAKELLAKHGVAVPKGRAAFSLAEVERALTELSGPPWIVKAQIHAGGRGKAGGIKITQTQGAALDAARTLLGATLVTRQTGSAGRVVRRLYIEEGVAIARELYLGLLLDRRAGRPVMMASAEGGMDIEEVAARTPQKILRAVIDPAIGMMPHHGRRLAYGLGLSGEAAGKAVRLMLGVWRTHQASDASLIEVNPLVVTTAGEVIALDAKITLDDNALFRHPEITALRDPDEEDPAERMAAENELNYIRLDGSIGCLVNGAGLAMATMDIIKLHGGEPANFLDVGGGATTERVREAFKIILADPKVRAILVNIFGGIMRCDVIAEGIVAAANEVGLRVPLVVRLEGTNVTLGRQILARSRLDIVAANELDAAAAQAVKLAGAA